ncbi:nitrous oxide reductase accessory protein NosL (plasmid) [Haloarcula salina]|uniref:nitrous oxide reductase accessory protein NosL n=1 Tax=Haloarcula salina TaxID=1429914 RepID=UPI003C6ECE90
MTANDDAVTRRRVLAGVAGATATAALAGCQGTEETADPVALSGDESCDQCGMVIGQHPGPTGQTYYRENSVDGHDPPARFCSASCTYRHRFANEQSGWTPDVTYLTDYSAVDYEVRTDGGATVISRHLDVAAFASSDGLTVVANSDVEGAMGPALVPFGDEADAEAFAEEYGGETLAAESISRELVGSM